MANENRGPFPRLFPRLVPVPASERKALVQHDRNGMRVIPLNTKSLLPQGAYGAAYEFFSPDGGNTIIPISGHEVLTTLALAAYWHVATRWRAQKISEAPLMVVEEDQEDGGEEWLPEHELVPVLEEPSEDYDMGELLERTSRYLDDGAEALWVMDKDNVGRVARITPFRRGEFTTERVGDRLYGKFKVSTRDGPEEYAPEDVCYFRDTVEGWATGGRSRLDVAMSWLRLGERARQTVRDLLDNSVWPSAVIVPDKDWNPDPETLEIYKQDIAAYGMPGNQGKPFVQLGGGSFVQLAAKIRDLVPEELLNRVESVVSSVSGVPAVVLQFQVGLENSPWSHMETARKMAYTDVIVPAWRKMERVLTRQMLRPIDEDRTHFIRFDTSNVESLKGDLQTDVMTATMMGRAASLNERRKLMRLEPSDDPKADEIPELTQPDPLSMFGGGDTPPDEEDEEADDEETAEDEEAEDEEAEPDEEEKQRRRTFLERKARLSTIQLSLQNESRVMWMATTKRLLQNDEDAICDIVEGFLTDAVHKSLESKERGKQRVMTAVIGYLRDESQPKWAKASTPLLVQAAERSTAIVAADIGVSYGLLHPNVVRFSRKESGLLVTGVSKTTRDNINRVITDGLEKGLTTRQIVTNLRESGSFTKERAELIARTETTRAFNGAPQESLMALARSTDRKFVKTWSGALDDRERDEHVAMEGETVPVDQPFSNGRMFPDEPNCRCAAIYSEVE